MFTTTTTTPTTGHLAMIIQQQEEVGDAIFSMLARHYELNVSSVSSRTINLHLKRTEALKGKHPEMYQRPQHPQRQTTTTTTPPDEEEKNNKDSMLLMREIVKFSSRRWFGKQGCYSPSPPSSSTCSPSSSPNAASKVKPTSSIEAMVSPSPPTLLSGHHEESTLSATKDFLLPHQQPPTSSTSLTSKFPMVMELGDLLMSSLTACYRILSYLHLDSLLLPTVIYAEKFVRTLGQTDTSQVFDLFLTR